MRKIDVGKPVGTDVESKLDWCVTQIHRIAKNSGIKDPELDAYATTASVEALVLGSAVLLASSTGAKATHDLETGVGATYDHYVIYFEHVVPATDNVELHFRARTSAGYLTGATDYAYQIGRLVGAVETLVNSAGNSVISVTQQLGNAANEEAAGEIHIFGINSTSLYKSGFATVSQLNKDHVQQINRTGFNVLSASALTGFRLYASSGNIAGSYYLYGVKKA